MSSVLFSIVGDTMCNLQRERKIRIDGLSYGIGREGYNLDIAFHVYSTVEDVRRTFNGKIHDVVQDQAMRLLEQVK